MEKLAIVVPCYNEEEVLKIASEALRGVLDDLIHKGKIAEDPVLHNNLFLLSSSYSLHSSQPVSHTTKTFSM